MALANHHHLSHASSDCSIDSSCSTAASSSSSPSPSSEQQEKQQSLLQRSSKTPTISTASTSSSTLPKSTAMLSRIALGSWVFFGLFLFVCFFHAYEQYFINKSAADEAAHGGIRGGLNSMNSKKYPANARGPWEECLWMTGDECSSHIKSQVPSYIEIDFMHKDAFNSVKDFHPNRVIIWLDDNDSVIEAPSRGRRQL
mmetsp:Transcript_16050/g.20990  ORF Transcript_16050/g.20990 Transcript_16050/m.20990 type:complete len:199 (+) Transcript_16050:125-721(+)|eukprot:CAMPEP_0198145166 /NCGR_PEP_ID=MMETSP1443-20131203/21415_1 /TAXON_ID=186043 /ORGANISM="Entomoneis sp., Strain CCMP2396" /LENGTH=198 /DNA_ID=CAMNT_0043808721 /DNA_START=52 /DNA_END=651 /DNA_ORIENTATION=+